MFKQETRNTHGRSKNRIFIAIVLILILVESILLLKYYFINKNILKIKEEETYIKNTISAQVEDYMEQYGYFGDIDTIDIQIMSDSSVSATVTTTVGDMLKIEGNPQEDFWNIHEVGKWKEDS